MYKGEGVSCLGITRGVDRRPFTHLWVPLSNSEDDKVKGVGNSLRTTTKFKLRVSYSGILRRTGILAANYIFLAGVQVNFRAFRNFLKFCNFLFSP